MATGADAKKFGGYNRNVKAGKIVHSSKTRVARKNATEAKRQSAMKQPELF